MKKDETSIKFLHVYTQDKFILPPNNKKKEKE